MRTIRKLPWITDGANDFLKLKISEGEIKTVLEFGSGASTLWLASQRIDLISIEHDHVWYKDIKNKLEEKGLTIADYCLLPRPYNSICSSFSDRKFDLIIVDGRDRVMCAKSSYQLVRPGGYFMLDNDERSRYSEVHDILSEWSKQSYVQTGPDYTGWQAPHPWVTTVWKNLQKISTPKDEV